MSKKIVVLGPVPPPLGGVSTHIIRYIALLRSTGWNATAYSYTGTTKTGSVGKFGEILAMFWSIYLGVNPGAWDVLHVHYGGLGYFLALIPLLIISPGRKVVTFHSVRVIQDLQNSPRWLRRLVLSQLDRFDLLVAVREGIGTELRKLGLTGPEITVMPAFLPPAAWETDVESLSPEIAEKILATRLAGEIQICCAAYYLGPGYSQDDLYGVEELLSVLRDLDEELKAPLTLWVLVSNSPDSEERKAADQAVRDLASQMKNVRVELCYGAPLVPVMARCQVFLRPSRDDGDSVAIREALGLWLPVLASDVVNRPPEVTTFSLASRGGFMEKLKEMLAGLQVPSTDEVGTGSNLDRTPYQRFVEKVIGTREPINLILKSTLIHFPIFLLLLALVFLSFGMLCLTPLWHPVDFQILAEAHLLVQDPGPMFHHIGFYFSQPALQLAFLAEYLMFGIHPTGFIAVNLLFHTVTSFLVYMLVNLLFPRKSMAVFSAVLFALAVGSYGKVFMAVHHLESLLLACLHLMVLYVFIRNDHRRGGGLRSPFFILGVLLFLLTGLTRSASFSLIGSLIAYKVFFNRPLRFRAVFSPDLLVLLGIGILYFWAQAKWGSHQEALFSESTTVRNYTWLSLKTVFRYLTLMFFPMQNSRLIDTVPFFVSWAWEAREVIRTFLALSIISYSFFGFVFGSKAIRFFITWTFISLLPFTGITVTGSWLNLEHLYLTSLGFCVILAAGAIGTSGLLVRRKWRRYIPFLFPLTFVLISLVMTNKFDERNKFRAQMPEVVEMREELEILTQSPRAEIRK